MSDTAPNDRPLDVITMGRAGVDLYGEQIGGRLEDMTSFAKYLGGCPANIAVGSARLGLRAAMLTRVGDEHMGRFVRETLALEGVDVSHVKTDPDRLTAMAILGIRDSNTFPLIFYRENCADMAIEAADVDAPFVASARALVVTGTHFSTPTTEAACLTAIRFAREVGTKVVFDVDYRPVLWGLAGRGMGEKRFVESEAVSAHLQKIVPLCDMIVGTEEEMHIAAGTTETIAALRRLRQLTGAVLVLKRGADGCAVFPGAVPDRVDDGIVHPGFPVEVFNVLGAGDAFMAGLLRGWLRGTDWPEACRVANACGSLVVSRHGCAPAMPSWIEIKDFLDRVSRKGKELPAALHGDQRASTLHRVTTRRQSWPQVLALAFDHRRQFEELSDRWGSPPQRIERFKSLIQEAVIRLRSEVGGIGVLVDDHYGKHCLSSMTGEGLWIARPIERARTTPLTFEHGPDIVTTLRSWPAEHVAKVLISYRPDDPAELRSLQEERLAMVFEACIATGHELLIEVVPPRIDPADAINPLAATLERFYAIGIEPDWWKLPPLPQPAAWRRVGSIIRVNDAYCRGILVLGQQVSEEVLHRSFDAAAGEPLVRGFAIGRNIFWMPAEQWFAGEIGDDRAVELMVQKFRHVIGLWNLRRLGRH